jgi:serine/threonine protein kinase
LGRLRRGPDSAVYRAVREEDGAEVALKVLLSEAYPIDEEAANLRRLPRHPNLVRVLGTGRTVHGFPFFAMEYHPEGSYADLLARSGPVPVEEAIRVGRVVAEALGAVHGVGLLHRDVTPANILRGADGPLLTDFGIAAVPEELSGTVALDRLTPHHAAPEALLRQAQDVRSDVYGLASTVWTLLAGYPPFAAADQVSPDPFEYRENALRRPLPLVPREDVPPWLQEVLRRAMAKVPADRYLDAAAFARALRDRRAPDETRSISEFVPVIQVPAPGSAPTGHTVPAQPAPVEVSGRGSAAGTALGRADGVAEESAPSETSADVTPSASDRAKSAEPAADDSPDGREGAAPRGSAPGDAAEALPAYQIAGHAAADEAPGYAAADVGGSIFHGDEPELDDALPPDRRRGVSKVAVGVAALVIGLSAALIGTLAHRGPVVDAPEEARIVAGAPGDVRPADEPFAPTSDEPVAPTPVDASASASGNGGAERVGPATDRPVQQARPSPSRTTAAPARPGAPAPTRSSSPTPKPSPTGGSTPNPYTPAQVCGSGYKVIDSAALGTFGKVYLLYNAGNGNNCSVMLKTASVGTKTTVSAYLQVQGGSRVTDKGSFGYYAGPVRVKAPGVCVAWGGSAGGVTYNSPFEHCG